MNPHNRNEEQQSQNGRFKDYREIPLQNAFHLFKHTTQKRLINCLNIDLILLPSAYAKRKVACMQTITNGNQQIQIGRR